MERYFKKASIPSSYHNFSDKSSLLGIPNTKNVLSNIAIALPALYLLYTKKYNRLTLVLVLLAIASSYYHLNPNKSTIVPDMILVITLNTFVLSYFVDSKMGNLVILLGVLSVLYWHKTSDTRLYSLLQLGIFLYCIYRVYPTKASNLILPLIIVGILTRVSESYDKLIYDKTNKILSGHSLKHIFAGIKIMIIIKILEKLHKI